MIRIHALACAAIIAVPLAAGPASAQQNLDGLVSMHAAANGVPEDLVRRVIKRESRGNARAVSKGNYGLMQIRLGTARGLGYRGTAAGLLDADTNMTYAVKYLANAYRVAGGNHDRAVRLYAGGYYYAAKRQGMLGEVNPNVGLSGVFASADSNPVKGQVVASAGVNPYARDPAAISQ